MDRWICAWIGWRSSGSQGTCLSASEYDRRASARPPSAGRRSIVLTSRMKPRYQSFFVTADLFFRLIPSFRLCLENQYMGLQIAIGLAILIAAALALFCDYFRHKQLKAALTAKPTGTCVRCSRVLNRAGAPAPTHNAPYAAA